MLKNKTGFQNSRKAMSSELKRLHSCAEQALFQGRSRWRQPRYPTKPAKPWDRTSQTLSVSSTSTLICLLQQPLYFAKTHESHLDISAMRTPENNKLIPWSSLHKGPWVCLFSRIFRYSSVPAEPNDNAVGYLESCIHQGHRYILRTYEYWFLPGSRNNLSMSAPPSQITRPLFPRFHA